MLARKLPAAPKAPAHLRPSTRRWFRSVVATYEFEEHHTRLLILAAESWDRAEAAREAIAEHGMTYVDRYGAPHARPEVGVEHAAKIAFARFVRELDLDAEIPAPPSRPPPLRSNRGRI